MDLAYMATLPIQEYAERRSAFFSQMPNNAVALIFSAQEQVRNKDCHFPFRQDSYFWYLTGFNEPDSALLLWKQAEQCRSLIFLRPSDPLMETWNGRRLGVENAPSQLQVDQAFAIDELGAELEKILKKTTALYRLEQVQPWGEQQLAQILAKSAPDFSQVFSCQAWLDEMRLFKSTNEIALMQQAGQISAMAHIRAMRQTRPNRMEYEIEGEIQHEFNRFGARFPAYNSIVAGGANACILHYNENNMPLRDGDLLLIDAGAEFAMYAGDITRTFPVNGKFSPAQKEIYELVLKAQKRAIELLVPGNSIQQANDEVIRIKVEGLVRLGILQGEVDQLITEQAHRQFYMHGLGHWLGLDVHDVGDYGENRNRPLEIGMVLTVEPGLYISPAPHVPEQYWNIGVRIEDNLLITEYGNKNLTSAAPKEIAEIEKIMAQSA